jgi:WD40 repeat protein
MLYNVCDRSVSYCRWSFFRSRPATSPPTYGRLASGSWDNTIRLRDLKTGVKTARLEIDAMVCCLVALPATCFVAGDALGRLHWLEIVD